VDARVIEKAQPAVEIAFDLLALVRREPIPLVDRDHEPLAQLLHPPEQGRILLGNPLASVQHEDHHVGMRCGLQGLEGAELLDAVLDPRPPAQPRGIDQRVLLTEPDERHQDAVAWSPAHST
jgi:hypothetical protein